MANIGEKVTLMDAKFLNCRHISVKWHMFETLGDQQSNSVSPCPGVDCEVNDCILMYVTDVGVG